MKQWWQWLQQYGKGRYGIEPEQLVRRVTRCGMKGSEKFTRKTEHAQHNFVDDVRARSTRAKKLRRSRAPENQAIPSNCLVACRSVLQSWTAVKTLYRQLQHILKITYPFSDAFAPPL